MFKALIFKEVKKSPEAISKQKNKQRAKKTKTPPFSLFPFLTLLIQEEEKTSKKYCKKLIKNKWDKGSHTPLPPFGGSLYRPFSCLHACRVNA